MPKDSLGIYVFAARNMDKIPAVRSYKLPEKAGGWLAYQLEAPAEVKTTPAPKTETPTLPAKPKKVKKNTDDNGYTLVLKNLSNGTETRYGFVKEYTFARNGNGMLFHSTGNDSTLSAGVYWHNLKNNQLTQLYQGRSKYKVKGLSISEDGLQTAFLVDEDTTKALVRYHKLYHWKEGNVKATLLADEKSAGLPSDWIVNEHYTPLFSKDGTKLFFGTSPRPVVQDTLKLTEEIVNVEVWTWKDDYIYPMQNRRLDADKKRNYLAVIHLNDNNRILQLAHERLPSLELGNEGNARYALAEDESNYHMMRTWDVDVYRDLTLIDVQEGSREVIRAKIKGNARLSPQANYVIWYSNPDTAWYSYSITGKKTVKLTEGLRVSFGDEEEDQPYYPSSYGFAGVTANDARILIYDRYDIWSFDPENNTAPINLTKTGRQEKIRYRYLRLDPEERFIDPVKEMLLSAFNETTKQSGYYKLNLKDGKLTRLIMGDYRYANTVKARQANALLFTRESFLEFPDVWVADGTFTNARKLSNANPQMKYYLWGTVEHITWTSLDNIPLEGLLYKPEGFDPKKKYPMIVNFYERNNETLHQHFEPFPHRSTVNRTMYTSNGYLMFIPDVVYKTGFPGESAMNCVMPGITALIAKGFVDEKRIGVQGHSWGGYQVNYMVTRTNLFAAAEAGATVANMISAYGGIRWESGLARMFQYEQSQSRIGGSLWEKPLHFIENSPIFFADKIQTPLLLLHNDADGAVPWYQGIEMYLAMRRLGKPAWMLTRKPHRVSKAHDAVFRPLPEGCPHACMDEPRCTGCRKRYPARTLT